MSLTFWLIWLNRVAFGGVQQHRVDTVLLETGQRLHLHELEKLKHHGLQVLRLVSDELFCPNRGIVPLGIRHGSQTVAPVAVGASSGRASSSLRNQSANDTGRGDLALGAPAECEEGLARPWHI